MEQAANQAGLIDTDIFVDSSRGLPEANRFLDEWHSAGGPIISIVSVMELIAGCRSAAQLSDVQQVAEQSRVVPISTAISFRARSLMESFTLSHRLLLPDALIAATALESGIALYTRNVRHYRMIPELLIIRPY